MVYLESAPTHPYLFLAQDPKPDFSLILLIALILALVMIYGGDVVRAAIKCKA